MHLCLWWSRYMGHVREAVIRCPTSKAAADEKAIELTVH